MEGRTWSNEDWIQQPRLYHSSQSWRAPSIYYFPPSPRHVGRVMLLWATCPQWAFYLVDVSTFNNFVVTIMLTGLWAEAANWLIYPDWWPGPQCTRGWRDRTSGQGVGWGGGGWLTKKVWHPGKSPEMWCHCLNTPSLGLTRPHSSMHPQTHIQECPQCPQRHPPNAPSNVPSQTPSNVPSRVSLTHLLNMPSNALNTLKCIPSTCPQHPQRIPPAHHRMCPQHVLLARHQTCSQCAHNIKDN